MFQYLVLPQGYSESPRLFTKILKIPLAFLRSLGHLNSGYLDDIYLQSDTYEECCDNIFESAKLLDDLGFTIHTEKSIFIPQQKMEFLGFILDSQKMLVYPTDKKCNKIKEICKTALKKKHMSIQELAKIIGNLVAVEPGNRFAPIYYKRLEILKNKWLKQAKGDYKQIFQTNDILREELNWWINNVDKHPRPIEIAKISLDIYTDASLSGYGMTCEGNKTGGLWNFEEKKLHINILEIMSVKIALLTFCKNMTSKHIRIFTDNTVTE